MDVDWLAVAAANVAIQPSLRLMMEAVSFRVAEAIAISIDFEATAKQLNLEGCLTKLAGDETGTVVAIA